MALLFSLMGLIAVPFVGDAFGHGGGADQAEPISFEGMNVTVRTEMTPADITVGEINDANIGVRFFDTITNSSLDNVLYRIEIWRSGDLLARNLFYDTDGWLDVEVRPIYSCSEVELHKCAKYYGEKHTIAGGLFARGESLPVIQGLIFDKGGLYNIRVDIEGAETPKTQVLEVLSFETFVSVAQKQEFLIQSAHAQEIPLVIKTYYDDIISLDYSTVDDSLTFDMPFDWSPDYITQVELVHQEIRVPKSFKPYDISDFRGYVNDVEVTDRTLVLDPFTYGDYNVIHFSVLKEELERINQVLGPSNHDSTKMNFKLVPQSNTIKNTQQFYLVNPETGAKVGSTVDISWDSNYAAMDEIPFSIAFLDENGKPIRNAMYAYHLYDKDNKIIYSEGVDSDNLGIEAIEGIDTQYIVIPTQETHRLDVVLLGHGLDFNPAYAGIGSTLIEVVPDEIKDDTKDKPRNVFIPGWVKSNAGLWSEELIDDATFVSGIQHMIKEGIILVPQTERTETSSAQIPGWVKSNAGVWSEGLIDDATFANGLQWLIANGIITV